MKSFILKRVFFLLTLSILSGCVAIWGKSYEIKEQNESGIILQYDTMLNSSSLMQKMAMKHCKKYNKIADIQSASMPGLLLGIIEERYSCIDKTIDS